VDDSTLRCKADACREPVTWEHFVLANANATSAAAMLRICN